VPGDSCRCNQQPNSHHQMQSECPHQVEHRM
jgi:hypothetical protein